MDTDNDREHIKDFSQESYEDFKRVYGSEHVNTEQSWGVKSKLNKLKSSFTKYVSEIKNEYQAAPTAFVRSLLIAVTVLAVSSFLAINFLTGNSLLGFAPTVKDHWVKKIDLKGLEFSQDQVIHGETHGDMFYVDGQIDGKPELFVYYRYVDDHGVVQDKLTPRKDVEIVEDLPAGSASYVEFSADYRRVMTEQEWADSHPNHEIIGVFPQIYEGLLIDKNKTTTEKQSPPCFTEVETCTGNTRTSDVKPKISVHLPKGAIIEHIDPNTIHKGENNKK